MSIYALLGHGDSPEVCAKRVLEQIAELGAVRMEADYSGGNDEGGVDTIRLTDAEGTVIEAPDSFLKRPAREDEQRWADEDGMVAGEYHPLWEAADDMLSTEYGTWAGDFEAMGTLFADTREKRVWTEGTEYIQVESEPQRAIEVEL